MGALALPESAFWVFDAQAVTSIQVQPKFSVRPQGFFPCRCNLDAAACKGELRPKVALMAKMVWPYLTWYLVVKIAYCSRMTAYRRGRTLPKFTLRDNTLL